MMATYFNRGSEVQADNLQKLYVMNRSYADEHQPLLLNQGTVHNAPHHLVGIPLAHSGSGSPGADLSRRSSFHEIPSSAAAGNRFQYNLWGGAGPSSTTNSVSDLGAPMGFRRQGLSLSLNNSSPAPTSSASGSSQSVILGSKYLKAAQQLLDEVVNVADSGAGGAHREKEKAAVLKSDEKKGGCEALSSAQRQELQMKKAKLLHMLDELEQRYKQYEMQMQRLGWALEQAAGAGTAKSYTWLALRTISKQFRCLQDAIASQVKETGRRLGEEEEEDGPPSTNNGRLRTVERQRAMQQLGVMHSQHNAWRPQRGLPERAVSLLRAWLFEHFLHPYPKDSDKHMLAKQTGLTRSQVSNWFINARVRLWKPMVEEMYVEEMKGAARHQNADCDDARDNDNDDTNEESTLAPKSTTPLQSINHVSNPNPPNNSINDIPKSTLISPRLGSTGPGFSLIGSSSSGMESSILIQRSPKRQRNSIFFATPDGRFGPNGYPVGDPIGSRLNPDHHHDHDQLGQIRYHHHAGNAVSLTLGLPHGENLLSLSGAHPPQQNFLSGQSMQLGRRLDVGEPEWRSDQPGPHSGGYEGGVNIQTRKRFAAQLLPDFVA